MAVAVELPPEVEAELATCRRYLRANTLFVHGYDMPEHQEPWAHADVRDRVENFSAKIH